MRDRAFESVLFVCQGNICRSPFAERLARVIAAGIGRHDLKLASAGLRATAAQRAPDMALKAAQEFGVSMEDHRAQLLNANLLSAHDLIVVMEGGQVVEVLRAFPAAACRVVLLPSFDPEQSQLRPYRRYNIEDPYGRDLLTFRHCFAQISRGLSGLFAAGNTTAGMKK